MIVAPVVLITVPPDRRRTRPRHRRRPPRCYFRPSPQQVSAVLYSSTTSQDDGSRAAATAALTAATASSVARDAAAGINGDIGGRKHADAATAATIVGVGAPDAAGTAFDQPAAGHDSVRRGTDADTALTTPLTPLKPGPPVHR